MQSSGKSERQVIFEFTQIGNSVRVTAMDCASLTEVVIVGSPAAGELALKRTALGKLNYVLARNAAGGAGAA